MKIQDILTADNLASSLSKSKKEEIAKVVIDDYKVDRESRKDWEDRYQKWQDMAAQVMEQKSKPWPGAANIKYPLLTQAALQFNARIVPSLMPNAEPVGAGVIGPDRDGTKGEVAKLVANHMNYQLTSEMDEWEEQFDSLLMSISISGTEYKKTYYDPYKRRNVSKHLSPVNLVVNYYAEDRIEDARKTEIHKWNKRFITEQVNAGVFATVDWKKIGEPHVGRADENDDASKGRLGLEEPSKTDSETPYTVLEYHGWYDLDGDGYDEPYIITIMEESEFILSIIPRYNADSIQFGANGKVLKIDSFESYTKYVFIPDPDGSFYGIGFGHLLYPINATVNTTINQLLDAGTLNNMPGGFISRGMHIKGGMFKMSPGKWFNVNTTSDDMRKGMVPLPVKDPSNVLFSLLTYMVEAGEKLSATTDIFTGEHPGQNTKAGVTQAVREEGQKVFTAVYKRIRRGLKKELDKLYSLNGQILSSSAGEDTVVARGAAIFEIKPEYYTGEMNIQPSSDPNIAVKEQKLQKDMTVLQLIQSTGVGNIVEAVRRIMNTLEVENIEALIPEGTEPPQNPDAAKAQQELAIAQGDLEIKAGYLQLDAAKMDYQVQKDSQEIQLKKDIEVGKLQLGVLNARITADNKEMDVGMNLVDKLNKIDVAEINSEAKKRDAKTRTTQ